MACNLYRPSEDLDRTEAPDREASEAHGDPKSLGVASGRRNAGRGRRRTVRSHLHPAPFRLVFPLSFPFCRTAFFFPVLLLQGGSLHAPAFRFLLNFLF